MPIDVARLRAEVINLLAQPCHSPECPTKPSRTRHWPNPRWGFEQNGHTALSGEDDFLTEIWYSLTEPGYNLGFSPNNIRAYCEAHYPVETAASSEGPDRAKRRDEFKRLRQTAFDTYGRTCADCGKTPASEVSLRLCLADNQPADLWSSWGVRGWNERHEFLAEQGWEPKLCVVRCVDCFAKKVQSGRSEAKLALRDRVLSGYGGACRQCGDQRRPKLWLVRLGGPVLRWGDSGRKLTSKQKYELLLRLGCPDTHGLMCPECWAASREGQGSGRLLDDQ